MPYSILVIWRDGEQEYLMEGDEIAVFSSRSYANEQRDFLAYGIEEEAQSVNVVPTPPREPSR